MGGPEGAQRASEGAPEERRDGRGALVGETQVCRGAAAAARGRPRKTFSRELGVTAATLSGWRDQFLEGGAGQSESAGSRCRQRRDTTAEITGGRSEHEQRVAAGENSPHGGRTPFGLVEVEAMSRAASPFTGRRYGVVRFTREWKLARSSFLLSARNRHTAGASVATARTEDRLE